ncbi:MAG: hypothetical protein ACK40G_07540 [Cytophagaceae bacterium]
MKMLRFLLPALASFLFFSCKKDMGNPRWDADFLAPIIKTSMGLESIIKDTSVHTNPDNSLKIVNAQKLYTLNLESLLSLTNENFPEYFKNVKLNTLVLEPQSITRRISLGEIAKPTPFYDYVIYYHTTKQPTFLPAFNNIQAGPIDLDANQFFKIATMEEGKMEITITNELPVDILRFEFTLRNKSDNEIIIHDVFSSIATGTSQSKIYDLSGKTIEGNLTVTIDDMDTAGKNGVVIDTADAVVANIKVYDLKVHSAIAVFPAQNVVDDSSNVPLVNMNDMRLTYAKIKKGTVRIDVTSTAEDNLYFNYQLPGASKNGIPFETNTVVPPATNAGNGTQTFTYDFSGYVLDLTGRDHDTVNSFYNKITGRIEYTGRQVHLSLEDSLEIKITMIGIEPEYVRGYLGRDTVFASGSQAIDLFNNIRGGNLEFQDIKLNARIENGTGVPGSVMVNFIKGNHPAKPSVTLAGPNIGTDINIGKAVDGNPVIPDHTTIDLKGTNGAQLVSILPHSIDYNIRAIANPAGFTGALDQFAYESSPLDVYLDMEIPLSVIAENLTLSDTIEFPARSVESAINRGKLYVVADNGFPLSAKVNLTFLNENMDIIETLTSSGELEPATLGLNDRVQNKKRSAVSYTINQGAIPTMMGAKYVVFTVSFSSAPANQHVKIYSDYKIDFHLTGDLNVTIK